MKVGRTGIAVVSHELDYLATFDERDQMRTLIELVRKSCPDGLPTQMQTEKKSVAM